MSEGSPAGFRDHGDRRLGTTSEGLTVCASFGGLAGARGVADGIGVWVCVGVFVNGVTLPVRRKCQRFSMCVTCWIDVRGNWLLETGDQEESFLRPGVLYELDDLL